MTATTLGRVVTLRLLYWSARDPDLPGAFDALLRLGYYLAARDLVPGLPAGTKCSPTRRARSRRSQQRAAGAA